MGWGFRKSIKIAPGVKVNLSKRGISTSIGGKGLTLNSRGRVTASIPGTGVRYTHTLAKSPSKRAAAPIYEDRHSMPERQSKREADAIEFRSKLNARQVDAVENYFLSHAIYVEPHDVGKAVKLDDHKPLFSNLNDQFSATYRAIKMADDLGSISLAEKERAFSALYEIEERCEAARGPHLEAMREAIYHLRVRLGEIPDKPKFGLCYSSGILGIGLLAANIGSIWVATTLIAFGCALAAAKVALFKKRSRAALDMVQQARHLLESQVQHSITPLP